MAKMPFALLVLAAMGCFLMGPVSAFTHIIGGGSGWTAPVNKTFYQDWAAPRTFGVGDKLVFPYRPGAGTVVTIPKEDFDACTQKNVITMYFYGPTIITLNKPGDYYYYSGVGKHCEAGQKLHVKVVNAPGSSGKRMPFKIGRKLVADSALALAPAAAAAASEAPGSNSPIVDAATTISKAAVPPAASAATTLQKFGLASGLLAILFSLSI